MIKLILVDVPQETSPDCKAYVHLFDRNENGWFMLDEIETELRDLPQTEIKNGEVEWNYYVQGWNDCIEVITE